MMADTSRMSQNGNSKSASTLPLMAIMMPSMHSERNFCPSCAPCSTATPAPETICAHLKTEFARRRLARAQNTLMSLVNSHPVPKPSTVEMARPYTTFIHSSPFTPPRPPCSAMAAPVMPAMSEWLCDVGMPKYHAATPHTMMATMAAASATSAAWLSPPKSTILKMVSATAEEIIVMPAKPTKLHTAAMAMAGPGRMAFVPTTVAMAFGASVAPLTMVAPSVRITMSARMGSLAKAAAKRREIIHVRPAFRRQRAFRRYRAPCNLS